MKITIECNEKHAAVIKSALDFYSRILMGQFTEIDNLFNIHVDRLWEKPNRDKIDKLAEQIRDIIYPELRGYAHWGIYNEKCPEDSKIAYDIIQVLRRKIVEFTDPEQKLGYSVDWKEPYPSSKAELVKVTIKEN